MKKKIIIAIVILVLTILFLVIKNNKADIINNPPKVLSTIPKNAEKYVDEKSDIIIVLDRQITEDDRQKITTSVEPKNVKSIIYQGNKIIISPDNNFGYGIYYTIVVNYFDEQILEFSFTTNNITPEQFEEDSRKQSEADLLYNDAVERLIEDYPWYTSLPIETKIYRIVYDYDRKMFRIRFLIELNDEDIQKNIDEALLKLEKVGATKPIKYYTLKVNDTY